MRRVQAGAVQIRHSAVHECDGVSELSVRKSRAGLGLMSLLHNILIGITHKAAVVRLAISSSAFKLIALLLEATMQKVSPSMTQYCTTTTSALSRQLATTHCSSDLISCCMPQIGTVSGFITDAPPSTTIFAPVT